jgi:D-amino-acid dehydrogenase
MEETVKVVVIGAGVVGLACAYELIQDGHDVAVVDSGRRGQASTHGCAAKVAMAEASPVPAPGMVLQGLKWMLHGDSPLYVKPSLSPSFLRFMVAMARNCTETAFRAGLETNLRLVSTASDVFDEWADAGLDFEMHQRGVLLAWESREHFEARLRYQDIWSRWGHEPEVLDGSGVHRVEPALSDRNEYGLFYPADRQIEPDSLIEALAEHVTKLGGTIFENESVAAFHRDSTGADVTAVQTQARRLPCDRVVLAAGVWTGPLAKQLGVTLPIRPGKGYSIDYRPAPLELRTSLTLEDAHVAVTPLNGVLRIAGTMEFTGFDSGMNDTRIRALERVAALNFRDWDPTAPREPSWAGLRPMTPDGLPIVGALAPGSNVLVASGHAMLGLTMAPTTARAIRGLVSGSEPEDAETAPGRFRRTRPHAA